MFYRLNFAKATQATAVLLRLEGASRMNYMRLLKMLYIADRESLKETGKMITGDRVVAMERGPVLSNVLDLIKGKNIKAPTWSKYIKKDRFDVELVGDPGIRHLSRYEIDKLQEISKRYEDKDEWELQGITHDFPEWKKNDPGTSSKEIPIHDILEAVGRLADEKEIIEDAEREAAFDRFFSRHAPCKLAIRSRSLSAG